MSEPDFEVFPNAPIEEAILAFEVQTLDDLELSGQEFYKRIRSAFPKREVISGPFAPARETEPTILGSPALNIPRMLRFTSEDSKQVVEVSRTLLAFHRLKPYVSWSHFESAVRPVWCDFVTCFEPEAVLQIRMRYVNRILLSGSTVLLRDYFHTHPEVPDSIEPGLYDYLMRLHFHNDQIPAWGLVTQRTERGGETGALPVVFDIEVIKGDESPVGEGPLWEHVNALRIYRNRLFFDSITEKTKDLFR